MAYLIFSTDGREWDRRELTGPAVLGRSADCDFSVHDIMLSRRHCRFTPVDGTWMVIDLGSRNGTVVQDRAIEERLLKTGDVVRVGKTKITFRAEAFVPAKEPCKRPALPPTPRGMDDTLAGTVFGMELDLSRMPNQPPARPARPMPRPRPRDPKSFETDEIYSMLEQIASSSWDSIYAVNAQPLRRTRTMPQPIIAGQTRLPAARPVVSLLLQATMVDRPLVPPSSSAVSTLAARPAAAAPTRRRLARLTRWITRVGTMRLF
jgi:predicted component of type VI protein secretion system